MFDGRWRAGAERVTGPMGDGLRRTGVKADHLTAAGLVLAGATAVSIALGHLVLGVVLLVASALPDLLDGAVAKASGSASPRGAFFDSVADRVTDMLVLGGVAWYLASWKGGHWAVLALAVLGASTLVSYERAKAESLGFQAKGGLMERAERIILLCVGLAFGVLVPVLWVMLVLTIVTAIQRFAKVWGQATRARPVSARARSRRAARPARRGAWREAWQQRRSGTGR